MANDFTKSLSITLENEGGLDSSGIGGRGSSNFGITQKTLDAYTKKKKIQPVKVDELKPNEAAQIYYEDFYKGPGFDVLPQGVSNQLFDFGVQSGPGTATKALQKVVGSKPDGILGPRTVEATQRFLEKNGEDALRDAILKQRSDLLERLIEKDPKGMGSISKGLRARIEKMRKK